MTLAQLGAEVVRVDPLGGAPDHSRRPLAPSGTSLYWTGLNKAKRSIAVDLRSAAGQELVTRLVADSGPGGGIVLTNSVGRSWLGYDALARRRPDLIHLRIEGNSDGSPAVDYTVNAGLGFPLLTGPAGHADPVNHVLPAWTSPAACTRRSACSEPSAGARSPVRARLCRSRWPTSPWPPPAIWDSWPRPSSASTGPGWATTSTAGSAGTSPRGTAPGSCSSR